MAINGIMHSFILKKATLPFSNPMGTKSLVMCFNPNPTSKSLFKDYQIHVSLREVHCKLFSGSTSHHQVAYTTLFKYASNTKQLQSITNPSFLKMLAKKKVIGKKTGHVTMITIPCLLKIMSNMGVNQKPVKRLALKEVFAKHTVTWPNMVRKASTVVSTLCMPLLASLVSKVAYFTLNKKGYIMLDFGKGLVYRGKKLGWREERVKIGVHVLVCWLFHGLPAEPDPVEGKWVCGHICGHPNCMNGMHMRWMFVKENNQMRKDPWGSMMERLSSLAANG